MDKNREGEDSMKRRRGATFLTFLGLRWVMTALSLCIAAPAGASTPAQIYATAAPAVVLVVASSEDGAMSGTGSIIDSTGLVLTNSHVIFDREAKAPYRKLWVFLRPDRVTGNEKTDLAHRLPATLVAHDPELDLALLKVDGASTTLPVLPMGDPGTLSIGSRVLAIGHPEQGGLWSLTTGVISAEWENFTNVPGKHVFQTETGLNRGNSGGPLIDENGQQIGVNTSMARKAKDGLAITSISFAVKSSVAKEWLAKQGVQVAYAKSIPAVVEGRKAPVQPESAPTAGRKPQAGDPRVEQERASTKPHPSTVLENQPEATPENGPGLPPVRPFSLDRLMRGLAQVSDDLESQMEQMQEEIRKRR
ncbi:MAG: serine protease [Nitrospira sp.]|nr:trypsin-like peptidase domain-containing protein [Nitrospira sp.]MBP6604778.1 trypsin-like peptidase domain-containing protein [Nitrospira sp.]HRA97215.1 serine protease [Nitrospira sp.]